MLSTYFDISNLPIIQRKLYADDDIESPNFRLADPMLLPSDLERGDREFKKFAETTFRHLVLEEERRQGIQGNSDLRVFCRLDISVVPDANGKLSYFVNEVTNFSRCALFLKVVGQGVNSVAMDIAIALRTWVAMRRSRNESEDN